MAEKTAKKVTGNKSSEMIIGMAASKLSSAVTQLVAAAAVVGQFEEKVKKGTLEIGNMEDQIGSLQQDFINRKAQIQIDTQLAYDANKKTFAEMWLAENGLVSVPGEELGKLHTDLANALQNTEATVKREVAIVTNRLTSDAKNAADLAAMQFKMTEAANVAKITNLEEKCKFLEAQVATYIAQLSAEREAGIKRQQAGSIGTLNVGNTPR